MSCARSLSANTEPILGSFGIDLRLTMAGIIRTENLDKFAALRVTSLLRHHQTERRIVFAANPL